MTPPIGQWWRPVGGYLFRLHVERVWVDEIPARHRVRCRVWHPREGDHNWWSSGRHSFGVVRVRDDVWRRSGRSSQSGPVYYISEPDPRRAHVVQPAPVRVAGQLELAL